MTDDLTRLLKLEVICDTFKPLTNRWQYIDDFKLVTPDDLTDDEIDAIFKIVTRGRDVTRRHQTS